MVKLAGNLRSDIIVAAIFALICVLFFPFVADDAYIVGRYALNAANGIGLVYNEGQYVSALTSPLHALIESALAVVGLPPVLAYRVIAPFLLFAAVLMAARDARLEGGARLLFLAFTLLSPFVIFWAVGGLETPLLAALMALFFARVFRITQGHSPHFGDFVWLGLVAGLSFLTRYDSMLVLGPVMLSLTVLHFRRPALWAGAVVALLPAVAWLGFAKIYYHDMIPTSAYVKLFQWPGVPENNILNTLNFILASGLLIFLPLARLRRPAGREAGIIGAAIAVSLVLLAAYALRSSAEHMMFSYRFFVPYFPIFALVLTCGLADRRKLLIALTAGLNAITAAGIMFVSINPAAIDDLPWGAPAELEYRDVDLFEYAHFMDVLEEDAADIAAHWAAQHINAQPTIFLYTGGTGYWLPQFHVYETLVDYRHGCNLAQSDAKFMGSYYVQDMSGHPVNGLIRDVVAARDDFAASEILSVSKVALLGDTTIGYRFLPNPTNFRFPPYVDGSCDKSGSSTAR